ncbi:MAG TPA: glycosyltransferase family 39 protein [Rhizomicrobium sp.]
MTRRALLFVGVLTVLRFVLAACLPLSFDESYFWLWSKHLAVSYYDHPPLIALAIRLGTLVFGDTEFGVRFVPLLASVAASWAVWRAAEVVSGDARTGALAACLFNATLMVAAESMSATPDSLALASAAFALLALVKIDRAGDGRWWLAAGLAIGQGLFAKYTAFFIAAGPCLWLVASPRGRAWLRTPWPYAGAVLALSFLISTLLWNAAHDWISFKFQFGRVVTGTLTLRYLGELAAGQLALASPFILALGMIGLVRQSWKVPLSPAAAMVWPALIYFMIHALHDRVQGNWPSFIYPALAILAAETMRRTEGSDMFVRHARRFALPAACVILTVAYFQGFTGFMPMGKADPIARMTGIGVAPVAADIGVLASRDGAAAIVTTKYATASWLSFYARPRMLVIEMAESYRWISAPAASAALLGKPLIYVTQNPQSELPLITARFSSIHLLAVLPRLDRGVVIDRFYVYAVSGFQGPVAGRIPNG